MSKNIVPIMKAETKWAANRPNNVVHAAWWWYRTEELCQERYGCTRNELKYKDEDSLYKIELEAYREWQQQSLPDDSDSY